MAKDLPYFKFFCSEWNDGDITLEDYNVQGVFINVCSYYWSNECDVTILKLNKRFKNNLQEIELLFNTNLIKKDEAHVAINFLDEQQIEREEQAKVKSKGGKASAEARRLKKLAETQQRTNTVPTENEHVLNSSSTESQLLREEEIREEKKRKEKIKEPKFSFKNSLIEYGFDKDLINDWLLVRKTKKATNTETSFNNFIVEVEKTNVNPNQILKLCIEKDWKGFNSNWDWDKKNTPAKKESNLSPKKDYSKWIK